MERKRKLQKTDEVTEAPSSSTAKERSSRGSGKRPRQMTGSSDLNLGSSSHTFKVTIHQLDDLTLTETFGKLDTKSKGRVARVCKRWRDLVDSPTVWKHTTVRLNTCSFFSAHLDSLKRRGIRRVKVTKGNISKRLRMLIYGLSSLEELDVGIIEVPKCRLAEVFPEALPSLKKLALWLDPLDFEGMEYVGHIFQNLEFCHYLGLDELTNVPDQPTKMPCLTSLRLGGGISLGDEMLHYLCSAFPNLKELFGMLKDAVTDDGMQQLAQLEEIQRLELESSSIAFPPLSSTLTAKLHNLHVLKLDNVGDEQLDALAHLPELEELEIGECSDIGAEGWRALDQGFRKLRCLDLNGVHFSEDAEVEFFGSLLSLEKIVFHSLRSTDMQMKSLCCALNHVHSMTITNFPKTNHGYMKAIADMENLSEFSLYWTEISDKELKQLAKGRAPLEKLAVIGCGVHDKSLLSIARRKKSLQKLELDQKIKKATLSKIVKRLPHLRELKTKVRAATKRRLQRLNPRLIISCSSSTDNKGHLFAMLDFLQ